MRFAKDYQNWRAVLTRVNLRRPCRKSYVLAIVVFVCPGLLELVLCAIFARIWNIISPLNSANFSTSAGLDNTNFPEPTFSDLGFPIWRSWYLLGWDLQEAPLRSIRFPPILLVCRKTFPVGCAQDNGNSADILALSPPTLETSWISLDSRVRFLTLMALPPTARKSVVYS